MGDIKHRDKENDPDRMMRKGDKLTKLSLTRWTSDWARATPYYEQAANLFKIAKKTEKAKEAHERAAMGQERLASPWHAGKHMESAGALAKELGLWNEVADFFRRASELYIESGKPQPAAEALSRGGRALEDGLPDEAVKMYLEAVGIFEEEQREQMAFDTYRSATSLYIKLQRYTDAATMLLRWGQSADKCKATSTQCKTCVGAVIVYLYAQDFKQAEQCQNDLSMIDAYFQSEQNRFAEQLLNAYREGNPEEVKHVVKSSGVINHLDHMVL
ncbi:hypothetical protein SELMODRAFT_118760 [Selaginella moellendorffii]|uniref:Gamma-soluble NSF attachment protein n=1 Tax=Selaginella moellendorffii TaxID=88036 RepID=D8SK27_SELML|nr:hypothetical protein SELMODRAFT_131905 [Selaginella moellendorffii]EFJ15261.1 hypothetical protein SELMODRAFT_118760 [Selaginella moellendorffii]